MVRLVAAASRRCVHGSCGGCNVLLITIDTLRARSGRRVRRPRGPDAALSIASPPTALRFTRAYSARAADAALARLDPDRGLAAGARPARQRTVPARRRTLPTLATVLKAAGYRTGAFVGAFVLDARFGLNRGFDVYDDRYGEKAAGRSGGRRRAPRGGRGPAGGRVDHQRQSPIRNPSPNPQSNPQSAIRNPQPLVRLGPPLRSPRALSRPRAVRVAARAVRRGGRVRRRDGRQAARRSARRRPARSHAVVVAADHGESLGEHGERTHGVFVYDATMRVPWIISGRDRGRDSRGSARSAAIDVRAADRSRADGARSGRRRRAGGVRRAVAAAGREAGASRSPAAYIEAMDANLTRNWAPLTGWCHARLQADRPADSRALRSRVRSRARPTNLFARDAERARTLEALLRATYAPFASRGSAAEQTTLSADARQRLQALGYVASSADPPDARVHRRRRSEDADRPGQRSASRGRRVQQRRSRAAAMAAVARDHARASALHHRVRHVRVDAARDRRPARAPSRRSRTASAAASPIRA